MASEYAGTSNDQRRQTPQSKVFYAPKTSDPLETGDVGEVDIVDPTEIGPEVGQRKEYNYTFSKDR